MSKPLLTKKRAAWAKSRKDIIFRGKKLVYNASLDDKYQAKLVGLVNQMTAECNRKILKLFDSETAATHFTQDDNISSQARILTNSLMDIFNSIFARIAKPAAEQMVSGVDKYSSASLHTSLKELSGGLTLQTTVLTTELSTVLKAATAENVSLIKSISSEYLNKVQGAVMRSITSGNGLASLQPALEKYEGITKRHAKNLALDQTRKTYNAINQARMQKLGLEEFEWIHTSAGQHPREQHIQWSGQIFRFDNLPVDEGLHEPVRPGQAPNCKCIMRPVLRLRSDSTEQEEAA